MVIIGRRIGRLANRLFLFGHFIASAIEHGYALFNPCFKEYSQYFESTARNRFGDYPIWVRHRGLSPLGRLLHPRAMNFPLRVASKLLPLDLVVLKDDSLDLSDPDFIRRARLPRPLIAKGWLFRDDVTFRRHGDKLREFFTPVGPLRRNVDHLVGDIRRPDEALIGVHVRRGDYATWASGAYFYNDDVYAEKMRQLREMVAASGLRARFLLCSDAPVDLPAWRQRGFSVERGTGHFVEDLYALARCDYILGPPSTFSAWAAFYGQRPYCAVSTPEMEVNSGAFTLRAAA